MNTERIKELAEQAGLKVNADGEISPAYFGSVDTGYKKFAALVAAEEREACAKVCEDGKANATDWDSSYWDQACENRAAAIRARGNE